MDTEDYIEYGIAIAATKKVHLIEWDTAGELRLRTRQAIVPLCGNRMFAYVEGYNVRIPLVGEPNDKDYCVNCLLVHAFEKAPEVYNGGSSSRSSSG